MIPSVEESTKNPAETTLPSKREKWQSIMQEYERSGVSARRFCLEHGHNHSQFRYWRSKNVQGQQRAPRVSKSRCFIPVKAPPLSLRAIKIVFPQGVAIECSVDVGSEWILSLIQGLKEDS